jgi:hypothetical protein
MEEGEVQAEAKNRSRKFTGAFSKGRISSRATSRAE